MLLKDFNKVWETCWRALCVCVRVRACVRASECVSPGDICEFLRLPELRRDLHATDVSGPLGRKTSPAEVFIARYPAP